MDAIFCAVFRTDEGVSSIESSLPISIDRLKFKNTLPCTAIFDSLLCDNYSGTVGIKGLWQQNSIIL